MTAARLLVCEKTGRWASALRQRLAVHGIRPRETRSLEECREELEQAPNSVVAVELLPAKLPALVRWLTDLGRYYPRATVIVLAPYRHAACEWLVREAGAAHLVQGLRGLASVEGIVRRHLESQEEEEAEELADRIWRQLPWPAGERSESV